MHRQRIHPSIGGIGVRDRCTSHRHRQIGPVRPHHTFAGTSGSRGVIDRLRQVVINLNRSIIAATAPTLEIPVGIPTRKGTSVRSNDIPLYCSPANAASASATKSGSVINIAAPESTRTAASSRGPQSRRFTGKMTRSAIAPPDKEMNVLRPVSHHDRNPRTAFEVA